MRRPGLMLGLVIGAVLPTLSIARAASKDQPDPSRVAEIAGLLPPKPEGVGRPITDREAWQKLGERYGTRSVIARAETLLQEPMPPLADDTYLDFSKTGNRKQGERVIFDRRRRVGALVLAECLENRGRFLKGIEEAIRENAKDKTWVLPAHDRSLATFRGQAVDIDLVSSATSWEFATAAWWLGDKLGPGIRQLIREELERRTFTPYEQRLAAAKPATSWWIETTSNWNAVCLAGVTGAAMASIESPQRRAFFAAAAEKHIQNFLKGFTPDGYCSEGMGYWNYGFGHFILLAETLGQATGGKLDLFEIPKVRQVALFGKRLEILPGIYPAFADCHPGARPDRRIQAFVSRRFGFGWAEDEQRGLPRSGGLSDSLATTGVYDFPHSASRRPGAPAGKESLAGLRDWFADAGILVSRPASPGDTALGVALKGGHNAEHHNHNDVGSFVVALGNSTPLLDPGAEVYTARTFSGKRYESRVLNSYGHPVPRVAGKLQQAGGASRAKVLKTEFGQSEDTLALDLRSAYPVTELTKLERTFRFVRAGRGRLTVIDEVQFTTPQAFGSALVTLGKWRHDGKDLVIGTGKGSVRVRIVTTGAGFRIEPTEIHEDLPGNLVPVRLGIELDRPVKEASITVEISG